MQFNRKTHKFSVTLLSGAKLFLLGYPTYALYTYIEVFKMIFYIPSYLRYDLKLIKEKTIEIKYLNILNI